MNADWKLQILFEVKISTIMCSINKLCRKYNYFIHFKIYKMFYKNYCIFKYIHINALKFTKISTDSFQ